MPMILESKQMQSQHLTPKMEQSLKILQMDFLELSEYVQNLTLENPVIEIEPPPKQEEPVLHGKLEWVESDDYRSRKDDSPYYEEEQGFSGNNLQNTEETIESVLKEQIEEMDLPKPLFRALSYLVGCLDDNGYLPCGLDILVFESGIPQQRLYAAWEVLKGMDPPGIGATSLSQCILLQLERRGLLDETIKQVVECYLEPLAKGNYQMIAERVGKPVEVIRNYVQLIGQTNPKPCASIYRPNVTGYVVPDLVVVRYIHDRLEIRLSDDTIPRIIVRHDYLNLLHTNPNLETVRYINNKLRQADWVVQSIGERSQTLLAVGQLILKKQREFFLHGPKYLVPMGLCDIAGELKLHPSTISRAISGKYLQCPNGSYPLKYFFPQGVGSETGNSVASTGIKEQIKEMIAKENSINPFSDQELADRLKGVGVEISRRTVAKYRDQLGIPPTLVRKKSCAT